VLALLLLSGSALAAQNAQDLYLQALVQERAAGSLEKAIALFERAANEAGSDRELAAKALLGAARAHEKLGEAKALSLYEQVSRAYPDQQASAAAARRRIAAIQRNAGNVVSVPAEQQDRVRELLDEVGQLLNELGRVRTKLERSNTLTASSPSAANAIEGLRSEIDASARSIEAELERIKSGAAPTERLSELQTKVEKQIVGWGNLISASFVTFTGTVREFSRHDRQSTLTVELKGPDGNQTLYKIIGGSAADLAARGWTADILKDGDVVTVEGRLAESEVRDAVVTLPDGRRLGFAVSNRWGTR
jgi:tetratricopeptide (TPR) repeat protein